jgi:hypothetical protein
VAYIHHRVRKPFSRITNKLSLVWRAGRIEENIAVFLSLIFYICIPDPLLCYVATEGIPVLYMELEIGQRLRKGAVGVLN